MHLADKVSTSWGPFRASTAQTVIDKEKEYFVTATWGRMWMWSVPEFGGFTGSINSELESLPRDHLVGYTLSLQFGVRNFIAETITVWHEREHMASFYRSGTHQKAMQAMKGKLEFRARRVWVKGADLPRGNDAAATAVFVSRVKNGEFREAVKATQAGAAIEVDSGKKH